MLTPHHIRDLRVDPLIHPRGQPHLSAASGLVRVGRRLYAVADDEHHLAIWQADGDAAAPIELHRILPGDLPQDPVQRKKRKADLEALVALPADAAHPGGLLVALGSGSRPNRQLALAITLDSTGMPGGLPTALALADWYDPLRRRFPDLNIEGALVVNGRFALLQRGNKGDARNAFIEYSLAQAHDWFAGRRNTPPAVLRIVEMALGDAGGVPVGWTDGTALPDGSWVFSAVAEDTDNSYRDGACVASAIGWVSANGVLLRMEQMARAPKVEGLALGTQGQLLMVTDSDDPATASKLLSIDWPFG